MRLCTLLLFVYGLTFGGGGHAWAQGRKKPSKIKNPPATSHWQLPQFPAARAAWDSATVALAQADSLGAWQLYQRSVQLEPACHACWREAAELALGMGTPKQAEAWLRAWQAQEPTAEAAQWLGYLLTNQHQLAQAIQVLDHGIRQWPDAGGLYAERGRAALAQQQYGVALDVWERGMAAHPAHPLNYYWAARFLGATPDQLWASIYAELFLNLVPVQGLSSEKRLVSQLLVDTWQALLDSARAVPGGYQPSPLGEAARGRPNFEARWAALLHQSVPPMAAGAQDPQLGFRAYMGLGALIELRTHMLSQWASQTKPKAKVQAADLLWAWQLHIQQAGHWQAYNYWLFQQCRCQEAQQWFVTHAADFERFVQWLSVNRLRLDLDTYLIRYRTD
jgi:tetratricopeptide (TPR) repeat protein